MNVRLLRVSVVVVPVALILIVLHFLGPGLRRAGLTSDLPEGYGVLREIPEYAVFGEVANERAAYASEVLVGFTRGMREEFGEMFRLEPPRRSFDVIVFSAHEHLSEFGRVRFDNDFEQNGGFYFPDDGILAVIDRGDADEVRRALFHEGTHMMLDTWVAGAGHGWSLWLNEGLATWFEDSRIVAGRVQLGSVSRQTLSEVRRGSAAPRLRMILDATAKDFQDPGNSYFYAASCLLVDFLMQEKYRERFAAYFEAERRPGPVRPKAFDEIIAPPAELEPEFSEWVRTRS